MRRIQYFLWLLTVVVAQAQQAAEQSDSTQAGAIALEMAAELGDEPESQDSRRSSTHMLDWTVSTRYLHERRSGFKRTDSTAFQGPPIAFRSRARARFGRRVRAVLVCDQDPGERFLAGGQPFDFVSGAMAVSDLGPISSFVAGDIRPRFGLGLSLWTGHRITRLATSPASFLRPSASVRPDGSTYEASRVRGLGAVVAIMSDIKAVAFLARTTQDAAVDAQGDITSLPSSGYHRNEREVSRNDRLHGAMAGVAILYESRQFGVGLGYHHIRRAASMATSGRPYQMHRFTGRSWRAASVFGQARIHGSLGIAGEVALDGGGVPAGLALVRTSSIGGVRLFISWRDYPGRFNVLFGAPPGASGSGGNERGWTVGLEGDGGAGRFRVSRDMYRNPWLQHDSFRPSRVDAWSFEAGGRLEPLALTIRWDARTRNGASIGSDAAAPFERRSRVRIQFRFDREPLSHIFDVIAVRVHSGSHETGEAIGQRLSWSPDQRVAMTIGIVFFRSQSGTSGVYLYEPDLPNYLAIPLLSGSGHRGYLAARIGVSRRLDTWVKLGFTRFDEEREIGSGVDTISTSLLRSVAGAIRLQI